MKRILYFFLLILLIPKIVVLTSGCAQIVAPTGGVRDTLPPILVNTNPKEPAVNFTGNRITLYFDEYVQLSEIQQNLLVSPTPKNNPYIDSKLKTVTIRLRDTLEPNTTYTINLGNAIRDINENNIVKDFRYVFSTGSLIDSLFFTGKVQVAETGKSDSTMIVLLYKNLADSAVLKQKPKYIARLDGAGNFSFQNLSAGEYKIYALKDGDGSKTYNSKTELFAFSDSSVIVSANTSPVTLYAYAEEKERPKPSPAEKVLKYTTKVTGQEHDALTDLVIQFNRPLKNVDKQKIILTDTLNRVINNVIITTDSTKKDLSIKTNWAQNTDYKLIILKDFATDTTGLALSRSDTIRFKTKAETDYGTIRLSFLNFDKAKNPVLQFVQNDVVILSYPLTSDRWNAPLFNPGEYEMRILYDDNKNGIWDPGNFEKKKQPEKVFSIPKKLSVRANFEQDIDNI
ncbi:MAG TPA: Ig-like domain-containing protein, partial [Chitinophagaceae bacterium]|nr:Ig-like domain-containing protein [Chitinophagaceae bacterium]